MPAGASPYGDKLKLFVSRHNLGGDITPYETGCFMPVLKEQFNAGLGPTRFARRFRQLVGLRFSHVCIVAVLLAAMYVATESYSSEAGSYFQAEAPEQGERR